MMLGVVNTDRNSTMKSKESTVLTCLRVFNYTNYITFRSGLLITEQLQIHR